MKFFIGAHYNLNNGDRALLEATIQALTSNYPGCEITVSALEPSILEDSRFKVVGWPFGSGIKEKVFLRLAKFNCCRKLFRKNYSLLVDKEYYKELQSADIILMSGGHHLTDILGKLIYYRLASNFIPAVQSGKKVVLLPQSIGPASDTSIRESIRYILEKANVVAYRDKSSKSFIDDLKCVCSPKLVPDLVYNLEITPIQRDNKEVGIALYHGYNKQKAEKILPVTMKGLERLIDDLLSKGYSVKIIQMDVGDDIFYQNLFNSVRNNEKQNKFTFCKTKDNIVESVQEFSNLDFVLAYKTHATIFSMICNTPLVAIAYHPKSIDFMESVGLKDYAINDVDANFENLSILIKNVIDNADMIIEQEKMGIENNRKEIQQFIKGIV